MNNSQVQGPITPCNSTGSRQTSMSGTPRLRFCIQRSEEVLVPMIALDELPASVRLMGVPVTMTLAEAFQAHLQSVGNEPKADGTRYQLEPSSVKTTSDTDAEEDYSGSDSSSGQKTFVAPDKKASEKGIVNWRQGPKDRAQTNINRVISNPKVSLPVPKTPGTLGKKIYCTYWIQTGNCNYMQEGCKFKHEIPEDEEMRRAIGFRAPPVWPRDEAGDVPTSPIRPAGGIHAKPAVTQQAWRRQGNNPGKVELPGAPNNSNRPAPQATPTASGPAFAHSPSNLAVQSLGTNTQYDAHAAYGATAFPAALPHFPSQSGHMTQHLPSHQAAQSFFNGTNAGHQSAFTGAAESYQQRSSQGKNHLAHSFNRGAHQTQTGSQASPTKQPPITRPMHLQQQSVGQHGNGPNSKPTSGYQILPRGSGHLTGARSASQDHALPSVVVKESDLQNLAGYISETTRSVTQSPYMPTNTPAGVSSSRVDTPSSSLGSAAFANHNATAFANNHNAPVHGNNNGSFSSQFQLHSPAPSTATGNGRRQDLFKVNVPASQAPSYQPQSPPPMHRRHFRAEGEPEYVTNPVEEVKGRSGNGAKKNNGHGKRNTNGGGKQGHGAKSKNPFEPLVDLGGQR